MTRWRAETVGVALVALAVVLVAAGQGYRRWQEDAEQRRREAAAQYAAEVGIEIGKRALRTTDDWSSVVSPGNRAGTALPGLEGPQTSALGATLPDGAAFTLEIRNNTDDPGFERGRDEDRTIVLRAIGRLPDGTTRVEEVTLIRALQE